jgi:hypothetical protein
MIDPTSYREELIFNTNVPVYAHNHEPTNKNMRYHESFSLKKIFGVHAELLNDTSTLAQIADNFLLFTPMLPEILSGRVEPINITIPTRSFCNCQTKLN